MSHNDEDESGTELMGRSALASAAANDDGDDYGHDEPVPMRRMSKFSQCLMRNAKVLCVGLVCTIALLFVFILLQAGGFFNPTAIPPPSGVQTDETPVRRTSRRPEASTAAQELAQTRNAFVAVMAGVLATKGPIVQVMSPVRSGFVIADLLETMTAIERRRLETMAERVQLSDFGRHRASDLFNSSRLNAMHDLTAIDLLTVKDHKLIRAQPWSVLYADFTGVTSRPPSKARKPGDLPTHILPGWTVGGPPKPQQLNVQLPPTSTVVKPKTAATDKPAATSATDAAAAAAAAANSATGEAASGGDSGGDDGTGAAAPAGPAKPKPNLPPLAFNVPAPVDIEYFATSNLVDILVLHAVPVSYSELLSKFRYRTPIQWFDAPPAYLLSNTLDVQSLFRLGEGPVWENGLIHPFPGAEANAHLLPLITSALSTTGSILEFGSSEFGTPILNMISRVQERYVLTADKDFDAIARFEAAYTAVNHEYTAVADPNPDEPNSALPNDTVTSATVGGLEKWSVAFVDSNPASERLFQAKRLLSTSEVVIVTHTEFPDVGLTEVQSSNEFKYAFVYDTFITQTAVLSASVDTSTLFESLAQAEAMNATTGSALHSGLTHCAKQPCQNYGHCVEYAHSYGCVCAYGYEGHNCEKQSDPCRTVLDPCHGHGKCTAIDGTSHTCECVKGWDGEFCDLEFDACMSSPCQNGGLCRDLHIDFECACEPGFYGHACEEETPKTNRNAIIALIGAVFASDKGSVLEIGAEVYSTSLIHAICVLQGHKECLTLDKQERLLTLPHFGDGTGRIDDVKKPDAAGEDKPATPPVHELMAVSGKNSMALGLALKRTTPEERWGVVFLDVSEAGFPLADSTGKASSLPRLKADINAAAKAAQIIVVAGHLDDTNRELLELNFKYDTHVDWFANDPPAYVFSRVNDMTQFFTVTGRGAGKTRDDDPATDDAPEFPAGKDSAHIIPMAAAVMSPLLGSHYPIFQMGASYTYATHILSILRGYSNPERQLLTADGSNEIIQRYHSLRLPNRHDFMIVPPASGPLSAVSQSKTPAWDAAGVGMQWGLVIAGHMPASRRKFELERFCCSGDAQIVMWLDAEDKDKKYEYGLADAHFRYKVKYDAFRTTTVLASNLVNVTSMFEHHHIRPPKAEIEN